MGYICMRCDLPVAWVAFCQKREKRKRRTNEQNKNKNKNEWTENGISSVIFIFQNKIERKFFYDCDVNAIVCCAFPTVCVLHFYFYFYIPFSLLLFRFGTLENRIRVYTFLRYKNGCRCAMCWNWWTCDLWFRKSFVCMCRYVRLYVWKQKELFWDQRQWWLLLLRITVVALPILLSSFPSSIPYDTRARVRVFFVLFFLVWLVVVANTRIAGNRFMSL